MTPLDALAIFAAGIVAGTLNTVVGSGTLLTFPVLLAFGYPPVVANVSNTVGLVPGSVSGAVGYRRELAGQRRRVVPLAAASLTGGVIGAVLLLVLPASAFKAIVPVFIAIAVALILLAPWLSRRRAGRRADAGGRARGRGSEAGGRGSEAGGRGSEAGGRGRDAGERAGPAATVGIGAAGIYGGYFGAAQGILNLGILSLSVDDDLQRLNAVKVVLTGLVNLVSGIVFIIAAHVDWGAAGLIAGGSVLGGVLGARVGRRLPAPVLRAVVVVVGVFAIVHLVG